MASLRRDSDFNMTTRMARVFVQDMYQEFLNDIHTVVPMYFDDNMSLGEGVTNGGIDEDISYSVGSKGLSKFPFVGMTDFDFMKLIESVRHEQQHVHQMLIEEQQFTDAGKSIALAHAAEYGNYVWYIDNYTTSVREIDASFSAIKQMREDLVDWFPHIPIDKIDSKICGYVNMRGSPGRMFPVGVSGEGFKTWQDVEDAYQRAMAGAFDASKGYALGSMWKTDLEVKLGDKVPRDKYGQPAGRKDEFVLALDLINPNTQPWKPFKHQFLHADDGRASTLMVASVSCYLHPELKDKLKALQAVDLSPETVFGMPFPESREEVAKYAGVKIEKSEVKLLSDRDCFDLVRHTPTAFTEAERQAVRAADSAASRSVRDVSDLALPCEREVGQASPGRTIEF